VPTSAGRGPIDETTIVPPPVTQAAPEHAWSQEVYRTSELGPSPAKNRP
jgi:hypothetical protein